MYVNENSTWPIDARRLESQYEYTAPPPCLLKTITIGLAAPIETPPATILRIIALGLSHFTFHSSGYRFVVRWLGIFAFGLGRFVRLVEVLRRCRALMSLSSPYVAVEPLCRCRALMSLSSLYVAGVHPAFFPNHNQRPTTQNKPTLSAPRKTSF
jgi:hypothetical protein